MTGTTSYTKHLPSLIKAQNGKCFYCGISLHYTKKSKSRNLFYATVDHIIPKSQGGSNRKENLVASCSTCNSIKGSISLNEFVELLDADDSVIDEIIAEVERQQQEKYKKDFIESENRRNCQLLSVFCLLWQYAPSFAQAFMQEADRNPDSHVGYPRPPKCCRWGAGLRRSRAQRQKHYYASAD